MNENDVLAAECRRIVRYLVGADPGPALVADYLRAHEVCLGQPPSASDQAMIEFARRHTWSLPLLDAATGLVDAESQLRHKIMLTLALLETDPAFYDHFAPVEISIPALAWRLGLAGTTAVLKAAAGLVLYAFVALPKLPQRDAAPAAGAGSRP